MENFKIVKSNYSQVINYLESFIGKIIFKIDPKTLKSHDPLERMRVFLELLGNPQERFKSILVGGTSGKGSTAYLISHILTTAGYKTGFTLSPHLQKINERLQINGKQISDEEFTQIISSMIQTIELMGKMEIGLPSYFEILIGMAFKYFADQKVDIAVVEVGMGGEFDATNTLNPLIVVLTNVGLDHTNILGNTVEKIARTKAGIIKNYDLGFKNYESGKNLKSYIVNLKSPIVVSGVTQLTVIKIIEDKCKQTGSPLNLLWRDFGYKIKKEGIEGSIFDLITARDRMQWLNNLHLSLLGRYQVENASLAVETARQLADFGFEISENAIRKALKTAFFPGRFEVLTMARGPVGLHPRPTSSVASLPAGARRGSPAPAIPEIILDGAHNPVKMKEFLKSLQKIFPTQKKIFIIGFKFDKDIEKMLKQIVKVADLPAGRQSEIIVTEFKSKTDVAVSASADALMIKDKLLKMKYSGRIMVEKDSKKALNYSITQLLNYQSIIVVTGSLYLVGEIRNML